MLLDFDFDADASTDARIPDASEFTAHSLIPMQACCVMAHTRRNRDRIDDNERIQGVDIRALLGS